MATGDITPYSTAKPWFGQKPAWVKTELDIERLQSYDLYYRIYWDVADTFKITFRGTNDSAIYVPTPRTIVEAINRYTAPNIAVGVTASNGAEDTTDVVACRMAMRDLFSRERFKARFGSSKRSGIIKGDMVWHLTADADKPQGKRISITPLDPAMYFPITDDDDISKVIAVRLAQPYTDEAGKSWVRVITYRKTASPTTSYVNDPEDTPGAITVEDGLFKVESWDADSEAGTPVTVLKPVTALDPRITSIPVYHISNMDEPGNPFGSSELRGFEMVLSAINQTMSDEDMSLAINGLGMYVTNAPKPRDRDTGQEIPWQFGPGQVAHFPDMGGDKMYFNRVSGVGSVIPYGDHYSRLYNSLMQASGTPDVAVGAVDVQVATSGIALALQLQPLLAKAGEKNDLISATLDQMWYDVVNMWMPSYEATTFTGVTVSTVVGDAVPVDRAARFAELQLMLQNKVIDTDFFRSEATKLGYVFPEDIGAKILTEQGELAKTADPFGQRLDAANGGEDGSAG